MSEVAPIWISHLCLSTDSFAGFIGFEHFGTDFELGKISFLIREGTKIATIID